MGVHALCCGKQQLSYGGEEIARALDAPYSPDNFRSYDYFTVPELKASASRTDNLDSAGHPTSRAQPKFNSDFKGLVKRTFRLGWIGIPEDEVYAIFQRNIAQMMETALKANVPIVFVRKAMNPQERYVRAQSTYRIPSGDIGNDKLAQWRTHYSRAVDNLKSSRFSAALPDLQAVWELSMVNQDRLLNLYIGRTYEALGLYKKATAMYESRLSPKHVHLNGILDEVAAAHAVPVIDAYGQLQKDSRTGIVGYNYFVDSVHMTSEGCRVLGTSLAAFIDESGYLPPRPGKYQAEHPGTARDQVDIGSKSFNAEVQTALGWSAFNQGDPVTAVRLATTAVGKDRGETQAYLLLVYAHTKLGDLSKAEHSWRELKQAYQNKK